MTSQAIEFALVIGLTLAPGSFTGPAAASEAAAPTKPTGAVSPTWPEVKCARYAKAWSYALARTGPAGLDQPFLQSHAAFLASGCTAQANVCPRSAKELELANIMVILSMNAGMASTFAPFACRDG